MSRSVWPQQSNPPQSPQDAYCRSHTWICKFALLHQARCTSWYWSIVLDEESSLLTTFNSPFGGTASCAFPLVWSAHRTYPEEDGPVPQRVPWIYQNCWWHHRTWLHWGRTWCPSAEPHADSPQVQSCVQSTENACKAPAITSLAAYMMPIVYTQIQRRLMLCMLSQHPQMSLNSKSSLSWWHTSAPLSMDCPLWLPLCKTSWEKMLTSPGMPAMRLLFSESSKPLSVTPPSVTLTHHWLWPYKSMPHR